MDQHRTVLIASLNTLSSPLFINPPRSLRPSPLRQQSVAHRRETGSPQRPIRRVRTETKAAAASSRQPSEDEGGGGGDDAGAAERGDAAARAVAVQPRPGGAQDPHAARLLLPQAQARRRRQRRRRGRGRRGPFLRPGAAAGRAGPGAGALLPAGGAAGVGPRRAGRDRLHGRGRALRRRARRLRRRRGVPGLRAVPRGAPPPRALRRVRRATLRARHGPGHLPQVRRRHGGHGHAPRDHGWRRRVPVHPGVDGAGARGVPAGAGAVPRPDPPPGALPAARPLRAPGLLPVLPQRRAAALRDSHLRRRAQAPGGHPVAVRGGGVHLLRRDRAPVARHVRRQGPPRRRRDAAPRAGQRPAAPPPAAPRGLLRECDRAGPGDRDGGGRAVAPAGVRGGADQACRVARGRRLRALRGGLPGARVGQGQPGGARAAHAGVGPVGGKLVGDAHLRRRLRVGTPGARRAGADVRQRHRVRDAGPRQGRPHQRALRARARVPADLREGLLRRVLMTYDRRRRAAGLRRDVMPW
ncbi:hypothetical protein PVAP13_2KG338506 [Panicum virgatum]|uniref:Uncharacterized protein n=1 Tax=Panicum virgatum TaxID=38727 RepID=A0A8T0W7T8_PANVG|nr:hypothetical protein PVAP13_2KG338506 [Panicum virgatum]